MKPNNMLGYRFWVPEYAKFSALKLKRGEVCWNHPTILTPITNAVQAAVKTALLSTTPREHS